MNYTLHVYSQTSRVVLVTKMSKRPAAGDTKADGSEQKKVCKVQSTLFKFFTPQENPSSSKALRESLDFSPHQYGIHVYSQDEIKSAIGLKQEFRKFWNEKAVELCKEKTVRDQLNNKNAIEGAIYSSWRLQCTHLLQLQAEEVIKEAEIYITDSVLRALFLSSINKNMERMLEAHASTNHVYEVMMVGVSHSSEKEKLEVDLHEQISRLKVAQNALKKKIYDKKQMLSIEQDVARQEAELLITDSPTRLSENEMEMIIHTFQNEYDEDVESD